MDNVQRSTIVLMSHHHKLLDLISTLCSLYSVVAVVCRPLRVRSAMSLLPFCVSPTIAHCWQPCGNLYRHDEVDQRFLQQNCSILWVIRSHHPGETMHHINPFCVSGLWISTDAHALDLYFSFHKIDTAIGHINSCRHVDGTYINRYCSLLSVRPS
jgi:hypothetical protein